MNLMENMHLKILKFPTVWIPIDDQILSALLNNGKYVGTLTATKEDLNHD